MLQAALKGDLNSWREKGKGISSGDHLTACLSNLRFPDAVQLFSTSLDQLKIKMRDFRRSTESVGLKIHPEKILPNQRSNRQPKATIDDIKVEVLPISEKAKYFGQAITFKQQETTEI